MIYTNELNKVLLLSRDEAKRLGSDTITPEHILLGLIAFGTGKACDLLKDAGFDMQKARKSLEDKLKKPAEYAGVPLYDKQSERILRILDLEAKAYRSEKPDTEHLLMAILRERLNRAATYLNDNWQIDYESMETRFPKPKPQQAKPRMGSDFSSDLEDDPDRGESQPKNKDKEKSDSKTPALDKYGKDLTKQAEQGALDPVIGRHDEIERVVQILSRRKKNNPILIGEPGVGKSAIVEGLALRIVAHEVSPKLFGKRIVTLDIASMVAGTTYRGQFEERMKSVINELQKNPEIILFIDEIHTIIGAGNASGSLDAANILKPTLARGEVQCIGATTINEYRKSVEKDGALERRFQKVTVEPTTKEQTFLILQKLAEKYGAHHNVAYSDEVLRACVDFTDRYISDRSFPDKAIDAMDEVGARAQTQVREKPAFIAEMEAEIETVRKEKDEAAKQEDFKQALTLRNKQEALEKQLYERIGEWQKELGNDPVAVTVDDVARVVSLMSGVPVQRVQTQENARLRGMGDALKNRVIGQDKAVELITKAIQRSRLGLKDPNRPIGTFFFLGPTGVGKTHLAQCLAEEMFGTKDALIRFDMSEYMEKHTTSLLVGAPPGYVAHEDGGKLTEAVRRKPYSIVLFDEIEKAHPDIFNILLQVLDEGRLTDRQGRVVDFKNTVIILTSNVGTGELKDFGAGIGFQSADGLDPKRVESILLKALKKKFPPEFVNRIDSVVTFSPLQDADLHRIIDLELRGITGRIEAMGYRLEVSDDVKNFLISSSDCKQYGARPLKRAIQTHVEDALTTLLLGDERGTVIRLILADDTVVASWVEPAGPITPIAPISLITNKNNKEHVTRNH